MCHCRSPYTSLGHVLGCHLCRLHIQRVGLARTALSVPWIEGVIDAEVLNSKHHTAELDNVATLEETFLGGEG